ncbi:ATP-binding cassette domain-containing protein [Virgibacillus halophilus]|uniref:ATP-binding cassette domain-containing protein n=1 Tax=Tigheibacillus halophilus TaxID=361280 RepID=A0ABU5C578_9BACI|nr:ATP-binding cassette domain-containing protein [Virgibacillus halophilus]
MATPLLEVRNLCTHFFSKAGVVKAVDGVNFKIDAGQTLGIVGESGSGKSITAMSIMGLIPSPPGKIVDGEILFKGENLLHKKRKRNAQNTWKRNFHGISGSNDLFKPRIYGGKTDGGNDHDP